MRSEGMVGASVVIGTAFLAYLAFGSETAHASILPPVKPAETTEHVKDATNVLSIGYAGTVNNYQGQQVGTAQYNRLLDDIHASYARIYAKK